jgi:uncharacterized membrane protein YphA (DoxX/SURF4 family)
MKRVLESDLIVIFRMVVGGVLLYASVTKIAHPAEFARDIANYQFLPFGLENLFALILPWVEVLVGLGLVAGILVDGSALLALLMMGMFIFAIGQAFARGYNIECGCGLKEGELVGLGKIFEDTVYLFMSWCIFQRQNHRWEFWPRFGGPNRN